VAGWLFGQQVVQTHLLGQIERLVGSEGAKAVTAMLASADQPGLSTWAGVASIVVLLIGAAGLFGELQDDLNTIWGVRPKPDRGIAAMLRQRFLSFSMVLGVAFLLLVSLVVSTVLAALVSLFGSWGTGVVGSIVNEMASLVVITLLFAMIYRFLPDARIAWRDVWLGAVLTALLFEAGKFAIGLYLGHSSLASAYGAAGSLAVLLVWLYYSAQIFLFGAELT
jgi:membrane protein